MSRLTRFLHRTFSIHENTDYEGTPIMLEENVKLRGNNIWILICACVLASIGLDTNSPAVIIGAMLISPLMSPIQGIGFGLATQDRELFLKALRNFVIAVVSALGTSFLYFKVSPLAEPTTELMARTHPNLLDVFIAIFGGVAGMVATSRSQIAVAIPGVAIATALMPPVCTAGFGLATGNWQIFLGASYLFLINAFFISLANYLVTIYLDFPIKQQNPAEHRRILTIMVIFGFIFLLPSAYFLYEVIGERKKAQSIQKFINTQIAAQHEVIRQETVLRGDTTVIKVYTVGDYIELQRRQKLDSMLKASVGPAYRLKLVQASPGIDNVLLQQALAKDPRESDALELTLDALQKQAAEQPIPADSALANAVSRELLALFPEAGPFDLQRVNTPGNHINWQLVIGKPLAITRQRPVLQQFLRARLPKDSVQLVAPL